jgi:DNA polymerase III subunit delta
MSAKLREADFVAAIKARPDVRLFFIFGQDESTIAGIASAMAAKMGPEAESVDIESDKLRGDPALLADEAASTSLFGDTRYIRLAFRREEGVDAIENLLGAEQAGNPVIATAGDLKKGSRLRKIVEASPRAMTYICYPPTEAEATDQVLGLAQAAGLKLDRALAAQIARYTGQDRRLAASEVEKLALYHDSSPERPVLVEAAAFTALAAETSEEDIQSLVNQVMGGEVRALGRQLTEARTLGIEPIRIVRSLQRRTALLAGLRAKVDGGANPGALVRSTKSIFWKEQDEHARQLQRWTSTRLSGLMGHLLELEKKLMALGGDLGPVLLEEELARISRAAARAK